MGATSRDFSLVAGSNQVNEVGESHPVNESERMPWVNRWLAQCARLRPAHDLDGRFGFEWLEVAKAAGGKALLPAARHAPAIFRSASACSLDDALLY